MEIHFEFDSKVMHEYGILRKKVRYALGENGEKFYNLNPDQRMINPLDDWSDEDEKTQGLCNLYFTQDIIDKYKDKLEKDRQDFLEKHKQT